MVRNSHRPEPNSPVAGPFRGNLAVAALESKPLFAVMATRRIRTDSFIDPCVPALAAKPPSGPDWVHEIKHDGYRLIVRRDGKAVRLFTRRGCHWTDRYPAIATAAAKLRAKSFTPDGEAVVTGKDAVAVFDALHRRHKATDAMLYRKVQALRSAGWPIHLPDRPPDARH